MKAVADTSSLVHPAKVPAFWTLMKDTFEEILIPEAVYQEILLGRNKSRGDVPVILGAIEEEGWIRVRKKVRIVEDVPSFLGEGEKEAISLMLREKSDWLLIDDKVARRVASSLGLEPRYSVYILPFCVSHKTVTKTEALEMLDLLVETGYYLRSNHYIALQRLIGEASNS